jgi:hypothetical protein
MSNTPQPIQFLLHQLATNEGDRERFNQFRQNLGDPASCSFRYNHHKVDWDFIIAGQVQSVTQMKSTEHGDSFGSYNHIIALIRTCLSRVNIDGNSVLGVFEGETVKYGRMGTYSHTIKKNLELYLEFDTPLRNGKPLDTAIQALHDKMLELVSEYREFINVTK